MPWREGPVRRSEINMHQELETFLALRKLACRTRYALHFDDETLADLLYQERLTSRGVEAHEVEQAREALLTDEELLA